MPEKDYLKVAKAKIHRPAELDTYRCLLIYGRNKKGKTRFCLTAGVEETLIIDPESGTDTMVSSNPFVWPIESWADLQDAYGALRTGKLSPNTLKQGESSTPFSWVAPDGLSM